MARRVSAPEPGDSASRARATSVRRASKRGGGTVTAAEQEERLAFTEEQMLELLSDRKAARAVVDEYKVHPNTALRYCRMVRERWRAEAGARDGANRTERLQEHRERFATIFRRSLDNESGSLKTAIAAAERLAQLDGFLTNKVEHSGPDGGPIPFKAEDLPDDKLDARIRELEAKLGGASR